jgi:hypothetical protein
MIERTANALLAEVALKPFADAYLQWNTLGLANAELERLRREMGGLWVGGTLTVSEDAIVFGANALNRWLQAGPLRLKIPMRDVSAVNLRRGVLTKIIEVTYGEPALRTSFRCFGAAEVADFVRHAAALDGTN